MPEFPWDHIMDRLGNYPREYHDMMRYGRVDDRRFEDMKEAYLLMADALSNGVLDIGILPYEGDGYIRSCVFGCDLDKNHIAMLRAALSRGSSLDIMPLTDGTVEFDVGFVGLEKIKR